MTDTPPKLGNRKSSPRFHEKKLKRRQSGQTEKEAAIRKAAALISADPDSQHNTEFFKQARRYGNDRGAAILVATNTENLLRFALARRLAVSSDATKQLFGLNGPMGTFDLKIKMGVALRIFGPETESNLVLIRNIRNIFAHSNIPVTFRTSEIRDLCKFLVMPFVLFPKAIKVVDGKVIDAKEPKSARKRFTAVCEALSHNLLLFGGHCFQKPRSHKDFNQYEIWLKPAPLP